MAQQGIHFAPCTGKQVDRVEARLGAQSANFWILGDSATRIKHQGRYVYQSLLGNALGLAIIRRLARLPGEHIVIACTAACAAIREAVQDHLKALVRRSYTQVQTVADFGDITADVVKITVYDEQGRCLDLRGQHDEFDDEACIVASDQQWIDIANADVHRGRRWPGCSSWSAPLAMRPWSLATGSTTRADGVRRLQFRHAQWPRRDQGRRPFHHPLER
nr:hypothetical protein [Aeromonas caviae]